MLPNLAYAPPWSSSTGRLEAFTVTIDEPQLISALRAGSDSAFMQLVDAYHAKMVRLAQSFVGDAMVAEEVAQEAWLGVLRGVQRFEGRSSLQTWIFTILTNCARTRAQREQRTLPFSDVFAFEDDDEPTVAPGRFQQEGRWRGHWQNGPSSWRELPENRILAQETLDLVRAAIETLPPNQRTVILLRDVDGVEAADVCNILQISESNQRVLLHRARAKVQAALARYLSED
jgi:RNA polymerase sigma-70 factor, ECF subfamily